jgi:hypothetical protein
MEFLIAFFERFIGQLQSPTVSFLLLGLLLASVGTKLRIPQAIFDFCVFMLLMRIGIKAGVSMKEADLVAMMVPAISGMFIAALLAAGIGLAFALVPGIRKDDALATSGLFGAVSGSSLVAGLVFLEEAQIYVEGWVPALYVFIDLPALVVVIVLAQMHAAKTGGNVGHKVLPIKTVVRQTLSSAPLSALVGGTLLGIFAEPARVFDGFYDPLFRGFLSVLMLSLGLEAYARLKEIAKVAHWYIAFALVVPIFRGFVGFAFGYLFHITIGFSPGGVIMFAIIFASSSDISGPPTIRGGIPTANPSTYIGASSALGTPVAIAICIPLFTVVGVAVFGL